MANFDRSIRLEFEGVEIAQVTDLRIAFEVDKNDGLKFNHGLITIFNFPKVSRDKIARPHPLDFPMVDPVIKVSLFAGYRGQEVQLVSGDVLSAINNRQGPTWMTNIDIYSGLADSSKGITQLAYTKPTSAKVISDQLLAPLGIDIKYTQGALEILQNKRPDAFSASGLSGKEATVFLNRYGLEFTIEEGGQGLVYESDRPRDPNAGKTDDNTFSPQNGLIGTPQITRSGINIKAQLRSRIKMFEKIFVESDTTTGTLQLPGYAPTYHVVGMKHVGDNRGADWFSEFECVYSSLDQGRYDA